jgi:hypothetical protein
MFCTHGYQAVFTGQTVHITAPDNPTPLLAGTRAPSNLWVIPVTSPLPLTPPTLTIPSPPAFLGNVYPIRSKLDLMAFYHAMLGSPARATLYLALKNGFLPSFPGLNLRLLSRYFTPTAATAKGHLDRHRRNYRSTLAKDPLPPLPPSPDDASSWSSTPADAGYVATHTIFTDMSGSIASIANLSSYDRQHIRVKYFLLLYHPDPNFIKIQPMASKSAQAYKDAYLPAIQFFAAKGFKPKFEVLDNVLSAELAEAMRSLDIEPRLVPPGNHRYNRAERMLRAAKTT